jgi:hypothetical protein
MDSLVNKLSVIELEIIDINYCTILFKINFLKVKSVILIFTKQSATLHFKCSRNRDKLVLRQSTGCHPKTQGT